jgi:DNA-binding transcriptional regulator YiaG
VSREAEGQATGTDPSGQNGRANRNEGRYVDGGAGTSSGAMTPVDDIRAWRTRLYLTQGQVASLIGVDERTWRRWELAEQPMPIPVARLLVLIERLPGALAAIKAIVANRQAGSATYDVSAVQPNSDTNSHRAKDTRARADTRS